MTISVRHNFSSGAADGGDSTLVRPSNWNAEHDLTLATDRLLGRDTAATGAVEEITVGGGIEFTGSGGIQTSAFTGDVTKTAGGTATTIASNAVVTAKIADANVTYAKIQNVSATDKILGRSTAGAGVVEEITCTSAARSILDDTTTAAIATTLGLGTASNPQFATIELGNASDTTLSRSSAGNLAVEGNVVYRAGGTDVPIADGGTGGSDVTTAQTNLELKGQQTIWVPAAAMISRTTNGAASGTIESSTNKIMARTFDFDTTTQEFAQFAIQMPKSWDEGTIVAQFIWSHPSTSTNFGVVWQLQAGAYADGDALDTALGSAQTAADTGGTTDDIWISPETAAITVAGTPGAEEYVIFQVARVPANASDTMAVDARLHGLKIHYNNDAMRDD